MDKRIASTIAHTESLSADLLPDPWRAYITTPHATRRATGAHSGLSPLLKQSRQRLEAFLAEASGSSRADRADSGATEEWWPR